MGKWLTRKKCSATETAATTTNQLISEDAFASDRAGDCSTITSQSVLSDWDASTDVSVVTSQVSSIDGDSHVESNEGSDVEPQSGRKHVTSDCNTKKSKYDDNYI